MCVCCFCFVGAEHVGLCVMCFKCYTFNWLPVCWNYKLCCFHCSLSLLHNIWCFPVMIEVENTFSSTSEDVFCHMIAVAVDVLCMTTLRTALSLLRRRPAGRVGARRPSIHPLLWFHLLAVADWADAKLGYSCTRTEWGESRIDKRSLLHVNVYADGMPIARACQRLSCPGPALSRCWRSLAADLLWLGCDRLLLMWCVFQACSLPVCPSRLSMGRRIQQAVGTRVSLRTSSQERFRADGSAESHWQAERWGSEIV